MNLTGDESVHLQDWPKVGHINEIVLQEMRIVRELITLGLAERAESGIKVRRPLAKATITTPLTTTSAEKTELESIIAEELNVKEVVSVSGSSLSIKLDKKINPELEREGIARELIRHIQSFRKESGLNVEDRIKLAILSDDPVIRQTVLEHKDKISSEVLSLGELSQTDRTHPKKLMIDNHGLVVNIKKV
jgi:isoleucyl-tRNA synthetase